MCIRDRFLPIGFVRKHTGLQGQVIIHVEESFVPLLEECEFIFYHGHGQKIPLFIEEVIELNEGFLIKFDNINDPDAAAALSGHELFQDEQIVRRIVPTSSDQVEWQAKMDEFLAYSIVDAQLKAPVQITEIRSYPQQEIAVLLIDGEEKMVPLDPLLITSIDAEKKLIFMSLPEGIFDI